MNCRYCGNPLSETARFCRRCGKPVGGAAPAPSVPRPQQQPASEPAAKPQPKKTPAPKKKWKDLYTVLIIAGIIVIGVIIWLIAGAGDGGDAAEAAPPTSADSPEENAGESDAFEEEIIVPEEKPADDIESAMPEEPTEGDSENVPTEEIPDVPTANYDVEAEVTKIREKYNSAVSERSGGSMTEEYVAEGITAFYSEDELKIVEAKKGAIDNEYRRFFYYDKGDLYFAYYEGSDSHRLYFTDNNLIRWRYAASASNAKDAVNYDCIDTEEYYVWMDKALSEAYELFYMSGDLTADTYPMNEINMVNATSALQEYDMVHSPDRIVDDDLSTAWVEDAYGDGINEAITVIFNSHQQVSAMVINAGYQKNEDIYYKNSRPKDITVQFSDGTSENFVLEDVLGPQDVIFSYPRETYNLTIIINSVYSGNKYQDTAISEIYIY